MQSIVPLLLDLFPDTVQYRPIVSGFDFVGKEKGFGSQQNIRARVAKKTRRIRNQEGQMVTSGVTAHLAGVFGVDVRGEFILPVRFSPRKMRAVAVHNGTDENGAHHEIVYFE